MNLIDLFTIYLACGAPFGVYYFLKNRLQTDSKMLWFKTLLNFLFWMPSAFVLLRQSRSMSFSFKGFAGNSSADSDREENSHLLQKRIEKILIETGLSVSIYEFRETLERYIGLTLAEIRADKMISEHEREIFRIAPTRNIERGSICLNRRNRKRLFRHQTQVRQDFLELIERISDDCSDSRLLASLSLELTVLLGDSEAHDKVVKMFADSQQTAMRQSVKITENDLWKPETHKPLSAARTPHLQTLNATANLRRKD